MTETGVETKRSCPGWMKLLLVISLMANVGVLGVLAGSLMKDEKGGKGGSRQVQWILELVPDDRRDFTKEHFREVRVPLRDIRSRRMSHLDEIIAAMRNEPFDPEAFATILAERRTSSIESRMIVHERLVALLTEFTPDERAIFATRLEARVTRWRKQREN